jgi:uncharacterized protein (DUF1330 family)
MAAWMVVIQNMTDPGWVEDYVRNVPAMIKRHGGAYLGTSGKNEIIENELATPFPVTPNVMAIFSFPSAEAIKTFMASEEYRPYSRNRRQGSKSDIFIMDEVRTDFHS